MDVSLANPSVRAYFDAATATLPVSVEEIGNGRGKGIVARRHVAAGETLWMETPLVAMQHLENAASARVCNHCFRYLGTLADQLQFVCCLPQSPVDAVAGLAATCPRVADVNAELSGCVVECAGGCGTVYCSASCRDEAALEYHGLLCVGPITDENHPLVLFKQHAVDTNEIFLLAARVIANVVARFEANGGNLALAVLPYAVFVNAPWWEVPQVEVSSERELYEFRKHLHGIISESFEYLRAALFREALSPIFTLDFFARVVGAFELNNVDMSFPSPLARLAPEIDTLPEPLRAQASAIVEPFAARISEVQAAREAAVVHGDATDCDVEEEADAEEGGDEEWEDESAGLAAAGGFDGAALCVLAGSMNHSCCPNVSVRTAQDPTTGRMRVCAVALRDVAAGEELCFSYIDETQDVGARQSALKEYRFVCTCQKCSAQQ